MANLVKLLADGWRAKELMQGFGLKRRDMPKKIKPLPKRRRCPICMQMRYVLPCSRCNN